MAVIRRAETADLSRIAEILVFGKRVSYRDIFKGALIKSGVWNASADFSSVVTKATGNPVGFPRIFGANGGKWPSRTNAKPSGVIYSEVP